IAKAIKREITSGGNIYGLEWGDPEVFEPLRYVRDRYVLPYVKPGETAVEIGPGGGRWTRYLLACGKLYVIDYHSELLGECKRRFGKRHVEFITNNGNDFPGVPDNSVDFLFSFDVFVHLDAEIIEEYLKNMKRVLKPASNAVIHYSDQGKVMARINPGFSQNTPEKMRAMLQNAGYRILEEDLTTMWHSGIVRFTPM
ncbi:MAG TPA: class I SAM-dependent methyltransferase, partial [Sedimentisphaerales bacterium]|nr:class I SAM-dependent methyltransferase [Sedimentisphaerales bacterium]